MATLKITYLGGLRTESVHLHSGTKLIDDAPLDNHGRAESFSPTDLVATALGSCMLITIGIAAESKGFSIDGATAEAAKIMGASPRRIAEIVIDLHFPSDYDDKTKQIIENTARRCPVGQSLHPDTKQTVSFHYKG